VEKFTPQDLRRAIDRLKLCAYFPSDPGAQAAAMEMLASMCPHREALEWLVDVFVNRVGSWKGAKELRGVLCSRYKPADGIEAYSTISGFTPEDSETAYLERHSEFMRLEQSEQGKADTRKLLQGITRRIQ
jgi:hypothetical protein